MGNKIRLDTRQETQITPSDQVFRPEFGRTMSRSFPEPSADETSKAQPNVALMKTNKLLHRMTEINECF